MKLGRPQGNNRRTAEALGIGQREFRAIAARWPQMSPLARICMVNEIKRAKACPVQTGRGGLPEPGLFCHGEKRETTGNNRIAEQEKSSRSSSRQQEIT